MGYIRNTDGLGMNSREIFFSLEISAVLRNSQCLLHNLLVGVRIAIRQTAYFALNKIEPETVISDECFNSHIPCCSTCIQYEATQSYIIKQKTKANIRECALKV